MAKFDATQLLNELEAGLLLLKNSAAELEALLKEIPTQIYIGTVAINQ
jgi:hypothetical protein